MKVMRFAALLMAALMMASCAQAVSSQVQPPASQEPLTDASLQSDIPSPPEPEPVEPPAMQLPNPIKGVDSKEEFDSLGFGVTAPPEAEHVAYSIIAGTTAQADFTLSGRRYLYRAANGMQWQMLSGVYESFDGGVLTVGLGDIDAGVLTVTEKGGRLGYWTRGETCRTLYTDSPASDEEMAALIKLLDEDCRGE